MAETYRSYVVRVKRPALAAAEAVHIDVEDLIGGGRAAVNGDEARALSERLRSLVGDADPLSGGASADASGRSADPPDPA